MILTGTEIKKRVNQGEITLEPFSDDLMNPNSYNYRLGDTLLEIVDDIVDTKQPYHTAQITIPPQGYVLMPGKVYLGVTCEKIGSTKFVPSLIGRSSLGRLGLFLQITADLGHLGTSHHWTLELKCVQPLRVYPFMRIGQVSFWQPEGLELLEEDYLQKQNNYAEFSTPQPTIMNKFI
ncbi:MAG: deoxycytidine deaminase [Patescibacteria group bacterium]